MSIIIFLVQFGNFMKDYIFAIYMYIIIMIYMPTNIIDSVLAK